MVMIFFSQAAGSIFSIEAPSAMRALGTMIPVMYFVALAFDRIWLALRRALGKRFEVVFLPLIIILPLIPIAKDNYYQYFQRWIGGMDELSTASGMYAKELGEKTRVVLYTGTYYPGHPPFKMYRDREANSGNRLTTLLMWMRYVEDGDFAIFFHYDTWQNMNSVVSTFFPDTPIEVIEHSHFNKNVKSGEGFGVFVKSVILKNEFIKKIRGLNGKYSFGGGEVKNDIPVYRPADDGKVPYNASWSGSLLVPYYGRYRIYNKAGSAVTVIVDGRNAAAQDGLKLAEGFHNIKIDARRSGLNDRLELVMESKKMEGNVIQGSEQVKLDGKYLYNWKNYGLHSYYYTGKMWDQGPIAFEVNNMEIDVGSFQGADCQVLKGYINIPESGNYSIIPASNIYARLIIDKKYYTEQLSSNESNENAEKYFRTKQAMTKVQSFSLSKGRHQIEIYAGANGFNVKWMKPGSNTYAPVPVNLFEPDYVVSAE